MRTILDLFTVHMVWSLGQLVTLVQFIANCLSLSLALTIYFPFDLVVKCFKLIQDV